MSRRTYPRIGSVLRMRRHKCAFCDHQGLVVVTVQTTWTRGDDEVFYLCHEHADRHGDVDALLAAQKKGGADVRRN